jgi:N-methylhydantoinase A
MASSVRASSIRIGIDTGGTFTDVVAFDEASGRVVSTKTPSTPIDPAEGFMVAVGKVLDLLDVPAAERGSCLASVSHGTTVATNQLLEGKVSGVGFITTEGYEFILEIARQSVPDGYGNSYFWVKPPRIVPVHLVKAVNGRLDYTGAEVRPFDEAQATQIAQWFKDHGINTLGVCLLHSYANPDHERRMRDIIGAVHPEAAVSISAEVLREYREYERCMTTLVDAAVKPKVAGYVASIKARLAELRSDELPFYIMKSNGGVLSADEVVHQPISTVLSGPAAGALGAALITQKAGFDRVLTCDGGGTSTDVAVVLDGQPALTTEGSVGNYPSKIPMIDVVTVGAGGGSIAWLSADGALKVGPQSAGADPGPLCYRLGGEAVTITDAHLVLGRIPPHLLGGQLPLDIGAAAAGVAELAAKLGLSAEACAAGVLEISAWNQANALRQVTVQRGLDIRDFTLTTFGGSGSLLLCRLIDILGLPRVLVPPNPGNVSAFGLLTVDVRNDYVRTCVSKHQLLDLGSVQATLTQLTAEADQALQREGFAPKQRSYLRTADLRYFGQAFEVRVPMPDGDLNVAALDQVAASFHRAHRALYGYDFAADPSQDVEWVNLRVSGIGPIRRPAIAEYPQLAADAETGTRQVCFAADDYVETPLFDRAKLSPDDVVTGPAVIEEFGSTIPIHPGFTATVDRFGNLIVVKDAAL